MDAAALRAEFPVLEQLSYLNAGTNGPVPHRGAEAATARIAHEAAAGRGGGPHFGWLMQAGAGLIEQAAGLFACEPGEVTLTRATTDGVNIVVGGLELGAGDEILTSDEEHPGILTPLAAAEARRGVTVRQVPFAEIAGEVGPQTKLVACSHVSWASGQVIDTAGLAQADALVLLDGAQGLGAVPVDVAELGCDFYAASGQKWLCGPEGTGYLYVAAAKRDELFPVWPNFLSLADPSRAAEFALAPDGRRFSLGIVPGSSLAWAAASLDLLGGAGWDAVHESGQSLSRRLADLLAERGARVAPRGESTLVAWAVEEPEAEVERLGHEGYVIRSHPGRGMVRASVGAWSTEDEVERLAQATAPT